MEQFSVKEKFGARIEEIWNDEKYSQFAIRRRGFAAQDNILKNALMFIGLNPLYTKVDGNLYYQVNQKENHAYFKKYNDISKEVGLPWTHTDLLFMRETNQRTAIEVCKGIIGLDFMSRQLAISKEIIETAKPLILVVSSNFAREILSRDGLSSKKFEFEFDDEIGTDRIVNNEILEGTPVFFTSMLTGAKLMDFNSFHRRMWHVRYVKNYLLSKL